MENEMMVMNEETTAVVEVEEAVAELATVDYDETGLVEVTDDNGGINPIVAAGVGLGITGIVGGLTYMLMRKKRNKKAKNGKEDKPKAEGTTAKPASEEELEEYLRKLADEMKAANEELIKIKKNKEESEEEKKGNEEE